MGRGQGPHPAGKGRPAAGRKPVCAARGLSSGIGLGAGLAGTRLRGEDLGPTGKSGAGREDQSPCSQGLQTLCLRHASSFSKQLRAPHVRPGPAGPGVPAGRSDPPRPSVRGSARPAGLRGDQEELKVNGSCRHAGFICSFLVFQFCCFYFWSQTPKLRAQACVQEPGPAFLSPLWGSPRPSLRSPQTGSHGGRARLHCQPGGRRLLAPHPHQHLFLVFF